LEISQLVRGVVMRAMRTRVDGGSKGVNVTRGLAANGYPSIAVLPNGGGAGVQLSNSHPPWRVDFAGRSTPSRHDQV
jgi:1-phosphofructokinase